MAVSNRDRIGKAFEILAEGLEPWIDGEMRANAPSGADWIAAIVTAGKSPMQKVSTADPQFQLKVMWDHWNNVFSKVLGQNERTYVSELRGVRNRWAHNDKFNFEDAHRTLDTIERLLTAISSPLAESVNQSRAELLEAKYAADNKANPAQQALAVGGAAGLKPWREVVFPHDDVATGRLQQAEFAANLGKVHRGEGPAEYVNPIEFYRRTYLTEGLRDLLSQAALRVTGSGGPPVVDLQTQFGGGKTHSMLALYHLFSGVSLADLTDELRQHLARQGIESVARVPRAVLVGTDMQPGQPPTKADGTVIRTMWGELAWQLGGAEAYALVAEADRTATNPGDALGAVFALAGPCVVLIDEWVAYARQLYSRDDLPAGTFDTHFTFAQTLTEQASAADGVLVVVSIPASDATGGDEDRISGSDAEVGGVGGREALRRLRSVIRRMEYSWRPATAEESFEIVRRRLFEPLDDPERIAERNAVVRAFANMYRTQAAEFPSDCRQPAYAKRIEKAYPLHPELFDRLYEDWSTLERFQRTRGVLRLMAAVIHALWVGQDQSPLILPASVPLDDSRVQAELTSHLPDAWKPIIDADIDGERAVSREIDASVPNLGRYSATRRVARTIFVGSAPRTGSVNRGIEAQRIRLGCVAPGEAVATFGDALNRLSDRATHLYVEGARYWFGTQESVTRTAQDLAETLRTLRLHEVRNHIVERLNSERSQRGNFAGVHVAPATTDDVSDAPEARLVILHPDHPHVPKSDDSPALADAREIFERRGPGARQYRNMVVFLAADQRRLDELDQAVADYLAWNQIASEVEERNLDAHQRKQAEGKRDQANDSVRLRIGETFQWLLVPSQPDPTVPIQWDAVRVEGQAPLAVRASKRLATEGHLQTQFAPVLLRLQLDGPLASVWEDGDVQVGKVWDYFARYVYLPRLRDIEVLLAAVEEGPATTVWQNEGFAVAAADDQASGRYVGLTVGARPNHAVTASTLIVRPAVALGQLETDQEQAGRPDERAAPLEERHNGGDSGRTPSSLTRYQGSVRLDPSRLNRDFGKVTNEVIEHLTALLGSKVEITIEIAARNDEGFPAQVIRTVTENTTTLKFEPGSGFEER